MIAGARVIAGERLIAGARMITDTTYQHPSLVPFSS